MQFFSNTTIISPASYTCEILDLLSRICPDIEIASGDTDLQAAGLDSLSIVRLVVAVEQTFGVTFTSSELTAENFRTPAVIAERISAKQGDLSRGRPE